MWRSFPIMFGAGKGSFEDGNSGVPHQLIRRHGTQAHSQTRQHNVNGRAVWVFWIEKLVVTSWLVNASVISGLSAVMYWLAMSVIGLTAPKPPSQVLPVFPFPVGILLPVRILLPVQRSYLDLSAPVTGLPWRRMVLHCRTGHGGCRIGFPGRWDGTQLAGQIGATYVTVWIRVHFYYPQFRQITDLRKLCRLPKIGCDFPQLRQT